MAGWTVVPNPETAAWKPVQPTVAGAGPLGLPQPKNPTVDMQPSTLGSVVGAASPIIKAHQDLGTGILKGALSTVSSSDDWARQHLPAVLTNSNLGFGPPADLQHVKQMATPQNTAQSVGKGLEQAGEFFIPGPAEEAIAAKAAPLVGKALPAVKMGLAALGTGTINKAQGGNFGTGALAGGIGSGVAQGAKAIAPAIAEAALNIRKTDRAYKPSQAIGNAILNDTTGFSPAAVAESAQGKLNVLNPALNAAADRASVHSPTETILNKAIGFENPAVRNVASLAPARNVLSDAVDTATRQGERTAFAQLQPMSSHLGETMFGQPIPENVTPRQLLDLKRGFGNEYIHRWNPETMTGVKGTAGQAYHQMAQEFNRAVPEAGALNSGISNLIPIAKRAESLELNAPTAQKVAGRIAAHTGALTGGVFGAKQGYDRGGVGGALVGGTVGLVLPEALASPTGQMFAARSLASPAMARAMRFLVGGGLQLKGNSSQDTDPNTGQ